MPDQIDRKLLDKRVSSRYLARGRLDEKEYERHLEGLPDLAQQAVPVESDLDGDDFDDDEDNLEEEGEDEGAVAAEAAAPADAATSDAPAGGEPPREG